MAIDIIAMRVRLEHEGTRLRQEIGRLDEREGAEKDLTEANTGSSDQMAEAALLTTEREKDQALRAQLAQSLSAITRALGKMERGTYGLCDGCGQPIPDARLLALPHADLCISCKSKQEARRR